MIKANARNIITILFVIVLTLLSNVCLAQSQNPDGVDSGAVAMIINTFVEKTQSWESKLKGLALQIFRTCSLVSIALLGVKAALGRERIDSVMSQFIMLILFCTFVAVSIIYYNDWSTKTIIKGLSSVASDLGAPDISSVSPIEVGFGLVKDILAKIRGYKLGEAVGYIICAVVILAVFSLITAQIVFIKCEAIIAMNASIILIGLGGASMLKDYAINAMRYVLSVGFKLFVLQLLMGVGLQFMKELSLTGAEFQDIFISIAVSIVMLSLVKSIPDVCAGIINGAHVNSGAALGQAAEATAAGAAAAVGSMIGGVMGSARGVDATRKAAQLASMDGATGLGKAGHMAGSLWHAHRQAKAEGGNLSHGERLGAAMSSKLQEMKMRNLGLPDDANIGGKDGSGNG